MSAPAPFDGLDLFGYNIIYADPCWPFENYSAKGESRNPNRHYDTMSIEQIQALRVGDLARGDCACLLWVVDSLLPQGIETLRRWGFDYKTVAFTWAKRTRRDSGWHMNTGYYTRGNPEMCLHGTTGRMERRNAGVRQLIVEPLREHSRKPDRVRDDIVKLFGDLPRVELFARTSAPGWDVWGNEVGRFETKEPAGPRGIRRAPAPESAVRVGGFDVSTDNLRGAQEPDDEKNATAGPLFDCN
jgi:N6-adenosine-specific RNA methylase IME4